MTDKTLFLECNAGVSGDMTVAALIDLGADTKILLKGLESLNVDGYSVEISNTLKNGINAIDFNVILSDKECTAKQSFIKRNIDDIYCIINNSSISENAKTVSRRIFYILAEAESKAHKVPLNEVYFHESGAVDSIVDIVSAAICLDNLRIKDVIVEDIYDGHGFIKCRKGIIPVPVPAVVNIAEKYKLNIIETNIESEMVTPTGASIIAAIRTKNTLPANYIVKKIGYGAGKRKYQNRGVVTAYIIE